MPPAAARLNARALSLDHGDFGSHRSRIMNVVDSNKLEHEAENRFTLFGFML
jgi:hypothetical protein